MKYGLLIMPFLIFSSCEFKRKANDNEREPLGIDRVIDEELSYASIGKTKLSDYHLFKGPLADLVPIADLFPYDLNTPLFSDYASKKRFMYLPKGSEIGYKEKGVLDFPDGTILIKNFYYPADSIMLGKRKILETRLLIHHEEGWKALPYIWNAEQSEAYLEITGGTIPVALANQKRINYTIPDLNQCKSCHDSGGKMIPLGPSIGQLNRSFVETSAINQLSEMEQKGWLKLPLGKLPRMAVWSDPSSGGLDRRARAYLHANCAHCHNEMGPAKNSGLNLSIYEKDPYKLGVNKRPVAAGRGSAELKYGIVPGNPEASILVHRMTSDDPGTMMPELGRSVAHEEGLKLIGEWILKMF